MYRAKDFRAQARAALKGNWGIAVLTGLIALLLGADTDGNAFRLEGTFNFSKSFSTDSTGTITLFQNVELPDSLAAIILALSAGIVVVATVLAILYILIGGALTLGYARYNLNLIDRTDPQFKDLFSEFDRFGDGLCMRILLTIYTFLWSLLLVIPGIIATYSYSMTPYIMIEHPEIGVNEAIRRSKQLMKGNKWRLFCLQLSFIGWYFLASLFFGIGYLWVNPYTESAKAAFYRDLVKDDDTILVN
jgi:uncharacterized membrane protein